MINKTTDQIHFWQGDFGDSYTDRNPQSVGEENEEYLKLFGVTRDSMNEEFLADIDRSGEVLEVGANLGLQLENLRHMGFTNLKGIEINGHAIEKAKQIHPQINIIEATAFDIPFDDEAFDLVYTSGVLIHISPKDIADAMQEIYRVSKRYIWGFEYYAPELTDIEYRGEKGFLWKRDFAGLYQQLFPDLKLVKEKKYPHTTPPNSDQMFLLEKPQS